MGLSVSILSLESEKLSTWVTVPSTGGTTFSLSTCTGMTVLVDTGLEAGTLAFSSQKMVNADLACKWNSKLTSMKVRG